MRKALLFFCLLIILGCTAGCGDGADPPTDAVGPETAEAYDLSSEKTLLFDEDVREESGGRPGKRPGNKVVLLGMQFYGDEPVQLWGVWDKTPEGDLTDIYVYRKGEKGEIFQQGLPAGIVYHSGLIDEEGSFYSVEKDLVVKYDETGREAYRAQKKDCRLTDFCLLSEETIAFYVTQDGTNKGAVWLMETETGRFSEVKTDKIWEAPPYLGSGENGLLLMDRNGVWEMDSAKGIWKNVLPFARTSYALPDVSASMEGNLEEFRMTAEGLELLWADPLGKGSLETLRKVRPGEEKTVLVLRGLFVNRFVKEQVAEFNRRSKNYSVTIEVCDSETDREDYINQTTVQLAAGGGADIIYGNLLMDSIYSLIKKGAFEDLRPYMEASGIREEDYFRAAFGCFQDAGAVYGVNVSAGIYGEAMDRRAAGNTEVTDLDSLLDGLLSYEEKAVYMKSVPAVDLVREFLQGSETLWGMINWESGTLEFDSELMTKLLMMARQYGYDERNNYPAVAEYRNSGFYSFKTDSRLSEEGKCVSGILFDDGCHGVVSTASAMMINADSGNKEGAWEFIRFLLSDEVQASIEDFPVSKSAYRALAEREIQEGAVVEVRDTRGALSTLVKGNGEDLTAQKAQEIEDFLEDARPLPIRIAPILDIVCQEAQDYFDGVRPMEQVIGAMENRVGLYLREKR